MDNVADLIDKLSIVNVKLFFVCDKKANPDSLSKEELVKLMKQDVSLCAERSRLKNEINKLLGSKVPEEVKNYGST